MADRNLVTFEEERNEHGPHWTLHIDRSAAGQPGLFFTIKTEMHAEADKHIESLNRELTVVAKDGVALLAPVLSWLLTTELVEEVVRAEAEREGHTYDHLSQEQKQIGADIAHRVITSLISVGQKRIDGQYRVGNA